MKALLIIIAIGSYFLATCSVEGSRYFDAFIFTSFGFISIYGATKSRQLIKYLTQNILEDETK
ncbi:Uncharacterised protein [Elizabethkingia miricola]|uniref:Lipoprotein n=1 Tax=Elizabethkingia miricola TaxID=172045 RepID=A0ABD4DTQ5_ELIMR|nr:hypothetical protein ATB95_08145 [Elizabethkingia miricola]SPW34232.1 Uncharacterised protein [Elizabethkingia miricola]